MNKPAANRWKRFLLPALAALALACALCLIKTANPAAAEGAPIVTVETQLYQNQTLNKYFVNKKTEGKIKVSLSNGAQNFYYAVTTESTRDNEEWYQTAEWKKGGSSNAVALKDGELYSMALVAVSTAGAETYENYAALEAAFPVRGLNTPDSLRNFGVDTVAPRVPAETYRHYYVDTAFSFEDAPASTNYASGLQTVMIERNREAHADEAFERYIDDTAPTIFPEIVNKALYEYAAIGAIGGGLTLHATATEQQDVRITLIDNAGNGETDYSDFYLGVPSLQDVKYTEIYNRTNKESHPAKADEAIKNADLAENRKLAFNRAVQAINAAYNTLHAGYMEFYGSVLGLAGFEHTEASIKFSAAQFVKADGMLEGFTPEQRQKAEREEILTTLKQKKSEFAAVRFSDEVTGVSVAGHDTDGGERYYYYLVVNQINTGLKSYNRILSESVRNVAVRQVYTLNVLSALDGGDKTAEFADKTLTLKIKLADAYKNDPPTAGLFGADSFSAMTSVSADGVLTVTLTGGLGKVGLVTAKSANLFLMIGLPIILGVILLAGVALLICYFVKKGKKPDQKVIELENKLEEQRKITEIAKKAKEEEERINLEKQTEIERRRLEAIERIKEERRKALEEKERLLREEAEKSGSALAAAQLAEFERMAKERAEAEAERIKREAAQAKPVKKSAKNKAEPKPKAEKKPAAKRKPAAKKTDKK